jgi:uncharacterized RDD family membrane protein YckC
MDQKLADGRKTRHSSLIDGIDLTSLAVLFTAVVAIALILVGAAQEGTSPMLIVFPTLLGIWAIFNLRAV